jgi:hypothetical protein
MLVSKPISNIKTVFQAQDFASLADTNLSLKNSQAPAQISISHGPILQPGRS